MSCFVVWIDPSIKHWDRLLVSDHAVPGCALSAWILDHARMTGRVRHSRLDEQQDYSGFTDFQYWYDADASFSLSDPSVKHWDRP